MEVSTYNHEEALKREQRRCSPLRVSSNTPFDTTRLDSPVFNNVQILAVGYALHIRCSSPTLGGLGLWIKFGAALHGTAVRASIVLTHGAFRSEKREGFWKLKK